MHTRQLQQYTLDNYNNTHKTTNNNTHNTTNNNTHNTTNNNIHKKTTIHTRQLQQYTQDNNNNTHKTTNNNTHKTTNNNTQKKTTIHTRQLQQYTQDNYNNTHKTTTTIHTIQLTTIHTRQLQQYTQDNYNNTHKTTTTIHTRQLQKKRRLTQPTAKPAQPFPYKNPNIFPTQTFFIPTCLWRCNRQCSETSAYKIQTPGNHPKESIQRSEHGRSLKSRKHSEWFYIFIAKCCVPRLGDRLSTRC